MCWLPCLIFVIDRVLFLAYSYAGLLSEPIRTFRSIKGWTMSIRFQDQPQKSCFSSRIESILFQSDSMIIQLRFPSSVTSVSSSVFAVLCGWISRDIWIFKPIHTIREYTWVVWQKVIKALDFACRQIDNYLEYGPHLKYQLIYTRSTRFCLKRKNLTEKLTLCLAKRDINS